MIHSSALKGKITVRVLVGALASGTLTMTTLSSAPAANATCASFFGIGKSADCTSTLFSAAIAIGPGAQAYAEGLFGTAFAVGAGSGAEVHNPFGFATTFGTNSTAPFGHGRGATFLIQISRSAANVGFGGGSAGFPGSGWGAGVTGFNSSAASK